jgi:hypothetical protein
LAPIGNRKEILAKVKELREAENLAPKYQMTLWFDGLSTGLGLTRISSPYFIGLAKKGEQRETLSAKAGFRAGWRMLRLWRPASMADPLMEPADSFTRRLPGT